MGATTTGGAEAAEWALPAFASPCYRAFGAPALNLPLNWRDFKGYLTFHFRYESESHRPPDGNEMPAFDKRTVQMQAPGAGDDSTVPPSLQQHRPPDRNKRRR